MRFEYLKFDDVADRKLKGFKFHFEELANAVLDTLPAGRAQSLALEKLEEAYLWVGKSIRDDQLDRTFIDTGC
jgi:hypothetical protein